METLTMWIHPFRKNGPPYRKQPRLPRTHLRVEALEDRCLLSMLSAIPVSAPATTPSISSQGVSDSVYIGDESDMSVKRFNAATGAFEGTFVASSSGGLDGPRGLIFAPHHNLLVVNQNEGLPINGEIDQYDKKGAFIGPLVTSSNPNGPFAPRGIVMGGPHQTLYIADMGNLGDPAGPAGRLERFDGKTGAFLGDLVPTGFTGEFNPRGVVFGPDGNVYVSVRNLAPAGGEVLRFNPVTGAFLGDFVDSNSTNDLNRPEGLTFGPDGNLYVTSFRTDATDTDKILEFNGRTGDYIGKIDLDQVGQPRAFGQALLFGPQGRLFVPITGNGPDTGEVRRYDVETKTFDVFVPPNAVGGALGQPWYLTFGETDRATLAYGDESEGSRDSVQLEPAAVSSLAQRLSFANPLGPIVAASALTTPAMQVGNHAAPIAPTQDSMSAWPQTSATMQGKEMSASPIRVSSSHALDLPTGDSSLNWIDRQFLANLNLAWI
jgi:DNA-binding beta-propeller fold protein YncE